VVTRTRTLGAAPEEVWRAVANPERLPGWWPGVQRVEEASPQAWTTVMSSPKGRTVRLDFSRVEQRPPNRLVWRQEVAESPFERLLAEAVTEIEVTPSAAGTTAVALTERMRLRGFARLGGLQWRHASRRRLDGALDGLEQMLVPEEETA
jgi:uncharacterized protein YndB with AHSA1/START domain